MRPAFFVMVNRKIIQVFELKDSQVVVGDQEIRAPLKSWGSKAEMVC